MQYRQFKIMNCRAIFILFTIALVNCCYGCNVGLTSRKVYQTVGKLPTFSQINITDPNRFLNDLELSPLWKVEKDRNGSFVARARSITPGDSFDGTGRMFLFELLAKTHITLPKDYRIHNTYLYYLKDHHISSIFSIDIVFHKPDQDGVVFGQSGQKITLGIYDASTNHITSNSWSNLAIKLSSEHEIYVILREQSADLTRETTFSKVAGVLKEIETTANKSDYRVADRYANFFKLFFTLPLKAHELRRMPGIQDRDTFCGYFRTRPHTSYEGINIKISNPVYCPEECTRKSERLRKAEYLGTPYHAGDILFFLIEDNAVYLSGAADEKFGTFTGKESFDGTLEILNDRGVVLLKSKDKFKSWQR